MADVTIIEPGRYRTESPSRDVHMNEDEMAAAVDSLVSGTGDDGRCSSAPDSAVGDLSSPQPTPPEPSGMRLFSDAYDTLYGYGKCPRLGFA